MALVDLTASFKNVIPFPCFVLIANVREVMTSSSYSNIDE